MKLVQASRHGKGSGEKEVGTLKKWRKCQKQVEKGLRTGWSGRGEVGLGHTSGQVLFSSHHVSLRVLWPQAAESRASHWPKQYGSWEAGQLSSHLTWGFKNVTEDSGSLSPVYHLHAGFS